MGAESRACARRKNNDSQPGSAGFSIMLRFLHPSFTCETACLAMRQSSAVTAEAGRKRA